MGFVEVREPHTGRLLFKFDPERDLIEIRRRGRVTLVDLRRYRDKEKAPASAEETKDERR